jgi:hypothetical protein
MTVYPSDIDDDRTLIRIDDNLSELGSSAINQLREAVFAIEKTLGINPQGSKISVAERIDVLIGPDGNPRAEALQAVGLATLPIHDNQVASNAGIKESKLDLNFTTSDLNTRISTLEVQIGIFAALVSAGTADLLIHISGGEKLSDNSTLARHVASHIDLNAVPLDVRDTYVWGGLKDVDGNQRSATQVAEALLQINDELVAHQNTVADAHPATAITVDGSNWTELPSDLENVQETFNFIDNREALSTGIDRATLHSNGIPRAARAQDPNLDGYNVNLVPPTPVQAYLAEPNQQSPNDSINNGDDIIKFFPEDNSDFSFDKQFSYVNVGDIVRVNYGNGIEAMYPIKSIRFIPGSEWVVRINGYNLYNADGYDGYDGYARIDRARFDTDTWGVLAAAGAVPNVFPDVACASALDGVILGSPRGAVAVGIGFDPNKLDGNHYNLYLRLYPNGNPNSFVDLPGIDVTGNEGLTKGKYNIDRVVEETNKQFRRAGFNYRFIAFNYNGEFGIMLADHFNNAAFSIISGQVAGSIIEQGTYVRNVVADATDGYDALGLGGAHSGFATPVAPSGYVDSIAAASFSTLVIPPVRSRNYLVNGSRRDLLATKRFTENDGYWIATITNVVTSFADNTKTVEYTIPLDLTTEELKPGKTVVIQPTNPEDTNIEAYGRFIIGDVSYQTPCGGSCATILTVINGVHGLGNPLGTIPPAGTVVKVYFTEDSVPFNITQVVGDAGDYHRYSEVFVTELGESFGAERARMVQQSQAGSLLDTNSDGWRIRRVSPKLNGFRNGNDFRFFVRFFLTDYNPVTGEFDGYLGEPDGTNHGPLTRGKKDHPVRFYDKTYVNFMDIEFREDAINPGTLLMPDSVTRYVDIEVFSTLREHDEHFVIAGVSHNKNRLSSITDLRDFGTTSEENFTDSALRFIEAGERYLHSNGVVRGFAYEGPGITDSVLEFTGGLALVNGTFVAVDSLQVKLPEVKPTGIDVIEFFVCVTQTGQLKAVPKNLGAQFFDRTSLAFIESLSFAEIVNTRKDLTIIARVKALIADIDGSPAYELQEVTDARRHVVNQDLGSYTWVNAPEEDGYNANFITPEALMNWVNEYGIKEVKVLYVKQDSANGLRLSFNNPVTLIGGKYEITKPRGIKFASGNWKIRDAKFWYYPNRSFLANDIFNATSDWGAVYIETDNVLNPTISDVGIENTEFYCNQAQRPPFVGFFGNRNTFNNGKFLNNKFTDTLATTALAYAFVNSSPSTLAAPTFNDFEIAGTRVSGQQGLILTGRGTPDGSNWLVYNRVNATNLNIHNNRFGYIGTIVDGGEMTIQNNICEVILDGIIATMNTTTLGYSVASMVPPGYSCAHNIRDNKVYFIKVDTTPGVDARKNLISGNEIRRVSATLMDRLVPGHTNIGIVMVSNTFNLTNVTCSDNQVDGAYSFGIWVQGGATITGNVVANIPPGGTGIFSASSHPDQGATITGNTLHKDDSSFIAAFIRAYDGTTIVGNNFSHYNLNYIPIDGYDGYDGYGDDSFVGYFNGIVGADYAAHNTNQVKVVESDLSSATPLFHLSYPTGIVETLNDTLSTWVNPSFVNKGMMQCYYTPQGYWTWSWWGAGVSVQDGVIGLVIPVTSLIPPECFLLKATIAFVFSKPWTVYANGNPTPPNTFPEMVLEYNGVVVDRQNMTNPGTYYLNYNSQDLLNNTRPTSPNSRDDLIIRVRQGTTITPVFGGWVGPNTTAGEFLQIFKPILTYLY